MKALADAPRREAPSPLLACAHCGLPVGDDPIGDGPFFCCAGCHTVYGALRESGLGATFYRLGGDALRPAAPVDADRYAALDAPDVVARVVRFSGDGLARATLHVEGVHCAACVWLVERLPHTVVGVQSARLNLTRGRLELAYDPAAASLSGVARWLARFGYRVVPAPGDGATAGLGEERRLLVRMGISWALAGNAMLLAFAFYAGLDAAHDAALTTFARGISLALATAALFVGGPLFFRRAWASVEAAFRARDARLLHLDLPVSLGILGGYGQSAWNTMAGGGEVWFDSLLVLMAALLTARWLHLRALRHAREAADRLLTLLPTLVTRVNADGLEETVSADTLAPGDVVRVQGGDVLPADGVVVEGASALDRSVLTGESVAVEVEKGSRVEAGATNLRAPLYVRVEAAGAATRVGRLLTLVQSGAQTTPPPLRLADRVAPFYVLGALVLAAGAFAVLGPTHPAEAWGRVVALLVITCPCALSMATPLTYAVAIGRAARRGLFVKHEAALDLLTHATAVVLDKTGTLTEGRPVLAQQHALDGRAWRLAAALERESHHPIARAFRHAFPAAATLAPARGVQLHAGLGLEGWVEGVHVRVGRPRWVFGAMAPPDFADALDGIARDGLTPVAIALDGRPAALAGLGDTLRPDARAFVEALAAGGREVWILSGDAPHVVAQAGAALGLPRARCRGGLMPEDKAAAVAALARTHTVVMVGDGVNDAAALQAAHVGVAVAGGTSVSIVAADVFATAPGLAPLETLLRGARQASGRVRALLAFSILYNVAGVVLALGGFVTPLVAAAAMPLSSLTVVAGAIGQGAFSARKP